MNESSIFGGGGGWLITFVLIILLFGGGNLFGGGAENVESVVNAAINNQTTQAGIRDVLLSSANNNLETLKFFSDQNMGLQAQNNSNTLAAINAFAAAYPDTAVYMTLVPNAITILADKLPAGAPAPDQTAQLKELSEKLKGVRFLDVTEALLAHQNVGLYYHADRLWTSLGARYAFEAMAEALNVEPVSEYRIFTVSASFEGTLSARSGSHSWKDKVQIYVPQPEADYKVVYADTQKITASLYEKSALEAKDHYTVFFGSIHVYAQLFHFF